MRQLPLFWIETLTENDVINGYYDIGLWNNEDSMKKGIMISFSQFASYFKIFHFENCDFITCPESSFEKSQIN
jgi:hypothetical protein